MRMTAGRGWFRSSPAIGVVVRLFATFLILSFNLLMLNELLGWETRWYKPAWGTLSTFFFAALAWLFTPRLLIPAVQMYFTALLMIRFRHLENLIYGVSWWLALLGISYRVRRRERGLRADQSPRTVPVHLAGAGCDGWGNETPRSIAGGSSPRIGAGSHVGSSQSPPPR